MQLSLKFRDMLPGRLGNVVGEELDQLIANIVVFFTVEHNGDGTHGDVTANSIVVADDLTVVDRVTAGAFYGRGIGIEDIPETSIADGTLLARVGSTETLTGAWAVSTLPSLSTLTGYIKGTSGALSASASIAEADITDGTLLARVGGSETITGDWQFDGYVKIRDGSRGAATLAAYVTNDTNTGIYRVGADDMGFVAGGNKRLDVKSGEVVVTDQFTLSGTLPILHIYESDASADCKYWRFYASTDYFYFDLVNDAYTASDTVFSIERSGYDPQVCVWYTSFAWGVAYTQTGLNGSYNDVGTSGKKDVGIYQISASAGNVTWTGMVGGAAGKLAVVVNEDASYTLTLSHESASSSAANRFNCPGGVNYVIPVYGQAILMYYSGRWRVLGTVA